MTFFRNFLFLICITVAGTASSTENLQVSRTTEWAVPLEVKGLPNLHRVNANLYRSAQPDADSAKAIETLGIRTVLNLRKNDKDKPLRANTNIFFLRYPLHTWDIDDRDVLAVLKIITNPNNQPILVHCTHGADRTGLMMASYRMVVQGWTKDAAINEMKNGGYQYHAIWKNIIRRIQKMDIEKMRAELYSKH